MNNTVLKTHPVETAIPTAVIGTIDTTLSHIAKQDRVVALTSVSSGVSITSDWTDFMTIPAEFRPPYTVTIIGDVGLAGVVQVRVNPGGSVQVRGEAATNATVRATGAWII